MNILFLTLSKLNNLEERGIYTDLLRKFLAEGHQVNVLYPQERRDWEKNYTMSIPNAKLVAVKTLNIQKTNFVEKGISTILIEKQFINAIKMHFANVKFDLVLFTTPPITFAKVVEYVKQRDNCFSYLLLKDIFPQNAVDLGFFNKKNILYHYFRWKEKELYAIADKIGCLSPANVQFLLKNNKDLSPEKLEINSNSVEPLQAVWSSEQIIEIKKRYDIPVDRKIFLYGGNLGKPQGLDFLLETILHNREKKAFFLIVGHGTEYNRIKQWFDENKPSNAKLINYLPKDEYDRLIGACDVGMVFLHPAFTIPNFPSRLLSYLENSFPVLCATDPNTDIGDIVEAAGAGFKVISGDITTMNEAVGKLCGDQDKFNQMKKNAYRLLTENYLVQNSYDKIISHLLKQ